MRFTFEGGGGVEKQSIDIGRCLRAMDGLTVYGIPSGSASHATDSRGKAIADAIALIQANGAGALTAEYIGVKNYSGFGDQRSDHPYGYGPKHGSIVFSIRRHTKDSLGADHVYLLECVRDFGYIERKGNDARYPDRLNLCDVLRRMASAREIARDMLQAIESASVESHEISARAA